MTNDEQERLTKFIADHGGLEEYPMVRLDLEEHPGFISFYEERPHMIPINEALYSYRAGALVTARCPQCGKLIEVGYLPYIDRVWVVCQGGHFLMHMQLDHERGHWLEGWLQFGLRKSEELNGIPGFQGKYSLLTPDEVVAYSKKMQRRLARPNANRQQINIADLDAVEVRRLLRSYRADNPQVTLIWPADRAGIKTSYADFAEHYDDLWYPARDDIWLEADNFGWLIEIDHEEIITVVEIIQHS